MHAIIGAAQAQACSPMPVNLLRLDPAKLLAIPGVRLGIAEAGIRKANRKDLLVIALDTGARVAGVFTQNRFCAAPVLVAKEHLALGTEIRALLVNTGCANAGTGEDGLWRARECCAALAMRHDCESLQVLPFSTGVIMEPLPVGHIADGIPAALADLREDNWAAAAEAIMTTDTVPKAASRRVSIDGSSVSLTGIAQRRRDDSSEHGDHACLHRDRCARCSAAAGGCTSRDRRPHVQSDHGRWRHLHQ